MERRFVWVLRGLVVCGLAGALPLYPQNPAPPQRPETRPAPGPSGGQGPSPGQGSGRPGGGDRPGPSRPTPGGPSIQPVRPNPGGPQIQPVRPNPGRPEIQPVRPGPPPRPNPGPRPPSRPRPPYGGRPPQWGRPPQNRPSYHFRPNDRDFLRRYYLAHLRYINRARRPVFSIGGYFPYGDIGYLTAVPPSLYGQLPPFPPGYQAGYFDGYVVVYDPLTYFIADVIDLLQ